MAHDYNSYATDGNLGAPSTGTKTTRRGILPTSTPGLIGDQYSQYGDDVFLAGHTKRNLNASNNANAAALGMGHDSGGYATGGVTLGAPSTGMTSNTSSTLSSPTPGSVGEQYSHYGDRVDLAGHAKGDFYSLNSASARALEMNHNNGHAKGDFYSLNSASARALETNHDNSGYVNDGNPFGAPVVGNTTTMGNSLSASTPRSPEDRDLLYSDGVYGTHYPNVNPNPSNNALPIDIGTAPGSNAHATNDTATGTANDSNRDAAANGTAIAAQSPGIPPTLRSTLSPSAPGTVTGPDGRPRWPCTTCSETFSRKSDMARHAKKHSNVLPLKCPAPDCKYKGSHREDKLADHRSNHGH